MDRAETVRQIIAQFVNRPVSDIDWSRWLSDYGVDSLSFVIFREHCERAFQVTISDADWSRMRTLGDVLEFLRARHDADTVSSVNAAPSSASRPAQAHGAFEEFIEVGMPLTGMNNLSETPLLKYVGDLRWRHIAQITGVKSRDLVDASGQRLYPAFFYVELGFPENRPMASFGENQLLTAVDRVERFGLSMIDGVTALIPSEHTPSTGSAPRTVAEWVAVGVPAIRLTNLFVMKFSGAEWLKKSRPRDGLLDNMLEMQKPPESYELTKQAEQRGHLELPNETYLPLHDGELSFDYQIQPDRDVNGVGLLYFANYPLFLDLAERAALRALPEPWEQGVLNKRSLLSRRIAYLNNAQWSDTLRVQTRIWMQDPRALGLADPDMASVELFTNQRMYRVSDGRLMCICSSRKLLSGVSAEEVPWQATAAVVSQ